MMKKQRIRATGVILLAMVMITGVSAQVPGGRGMGPCGQGYGAYGPDSRGQRAFIGLDLSEEQQEQMNALRLEHTKTMLPLRNEMAELKARERTLISKEEVDMKALNSVIDEQSELANKMHKLRVEHRVAVREILTEEQILELQSLRSYGGRHRGYGNGFRRPQRMGRPY
jgi:Spy/CpxP family protein refolding chaperone